MSTNKPVPVHAATWYRTSLALGLATLTLVGLLQSCGGQSGGSGPSGNSTPTADEIKRNSILTIPLTEQTQLQGVYKGNLFNNSDSEFLILVTPPLTAKSPAFAYAWYRPSLQQNVAYTYHGLLTLGTRGGASSAGNWSVNEGALTSPASVTIRGGSLNAMIADISVSRSNAASTSQMIAKALSDNEYLLNTGLTGTPWTGNWYIGVGNTGYQLTFGSTPNQSAIGSANIFLSVGNGCVSNSYDPSRQTWTWSARPGSNYVFDVTLELGSPITAPCFLQLSGPAVISHQNNRDQLDMMLLDGTGAGISYRGSR